MKFFSRLRLVTKMFLALLLVIFAAVFVVYTFIVPWLISKSVDKEKQRQYEMATQVKESISLEFNKAIKELESLASLDDIKTLNKDKIDYVINIANQTTQFYNYFFVLNREGKWLSNPAHPELVGTTIHAGNFYWVDSTFVNGKTYFMDIVESRINTLVSGFSTPISVSNGNNTALIRGVIVISENNLALELIKDIKIGDNGFVYIVSSDGNLVAHPHFLPEISGYKNTGYSGHLPVQYVLKGESGIVEYTYKGDEWAAAYTTVDQTGWGVIAQQPLADITTTAKTQVNTMISLLVFLMCISIFIVALIINFALKPLAHLVDNLENNNTLLPVSSVWSKDEIGRIGRKFEELYARLFQSNESLAESLKEYQRINVELQHAKTKAEESDQLKTAFLANLSHEIRTSMNGILGFTSLLRDGDINPATQKHYVDVIEQSGQRLLRMINDLVDISKIEAGQVMVNPEIININEIMGRIYTFFMPESTRKNIHFTYSCTLSNSDCHFVADALKLEQILTNLINNAFKFTSEGRIHFEYVIRGDMLVFRVEDTGSGISADMHEKVFERFRQVENTYLGATEGSGLGLAISKAFVELMGGKIWVESELGKGSVFSFTLPVKRSK